MALSTPQRKASNTTREDQKEKHSVFNVVVFCIFLLGLGALCGYTIFFFLFRDKCADLLVERDGTHNSSLAKLETKYTRALSDVKQCQEDSDAREKTKELEGRLVAQAALSDKHQELLTRHERTLEKISELQLSSESSQSQIQILKEEIKSTALSLDESSGRLRLAQSEKDDVHQQLKQHMEDTNKILKEREQDNMSLREVLNSCDDKIKNSEGKLLELRNLLQQNQYAQITAM